MPLSAGVPRWVATILVVAVCLLPLLVLSIQLGTGQLGPDPAKRLMQGTGEWGLRGLALVLLAAPLAQRGWPALFRFRRVLGLCLFLYVSLHLLLFAQVYVGWNGTLLVEELTERPYVLVGFSAWMAMLPLALTSTDRARLLLVVSTGSWTLALPHRPDGSVRVDAGRPDWSHRRTSTFESVRTGVRR